MSTKRSTIVDMEAVVVQTRPAKSATPQGARARTATRARYWAGVTSLANGLASSCSETKRSVRPRVCQKHDHAPAATTWSPRAGPPADLAMEGIPLTQTAETQEVDTSWRRRPRSEVGHAAPVQEFNRLSGRSVQSKMSYGTHLEFGATATLIR